MSNPIEESLEYSKHILEKRNDCSQAIDDLRTPGMHIRPGLRFTDRIWFQQVHLFDIKKEYAENRNIDGQVKNNTSQPVHPAQHGQFNATMDKLCTQANKQHDHQEYKEKRK